MGKQQQIILKEVQSQLVAYRALNVELHGDEICIIGNLDVGAGGQEMYQIKIVLDSRYPQSLPITYETAGRIKKDDDRHVVDEKGRCCLGVPPDIRKYFPEGTTIDVYVEKVVKPFFKNQLYYEIMGKFGSERPHSKIEAYISFWSEELGIDQDLLRILLSSILCKNVKGAAKCPCLGGRKQRKCCLKLMKRLRELLLEDFAPESFSALHQELSLY